MITSIHDDNIVIEYAEDWSVRRLVIPRGKAKISIDENSDTITITYVRE